MSDQTDGPDPTEPGGGTAPPPSDATTPPPPGTDETPAVAAGADDDAAAAQETAPPPMAPPPAVATDPTAAAAAAASTGWPTSAKVWVGVLAVLALLAGAAAVAGFSEASSTGDDKTTVEAERDAAIDRAQSAEQERDELATALEQSEETVETLTNELAAANAALEEAQAEIEILTAALETERARAEAAEAELADTQATIDAIFPITVDTSLVGLDLAGTYTISFEEKYCDFATGCGITPDANQAIIGVTPENFLDITVPGILQGGLFAVNGGLYAITDSETAIQPCGDVPRRGRVTITIWPSSIVVGEDGVAVPTALEASITLDAPTINECPSGLVFWGAKLIPAG